VTVAFGRARADGKHMTFVFPSASLAAMRAHRWPGNVRELALVVSNALVFALSDALAAARRGTGATAAAARVVPVPAQTIRRLMTEASPAHGRRGATIELELQAHRALRSVARDLERQLYEDLYRRSDGDFAAMARQLLGVATPAAARKVRLRFNQLGLRARKS
jgi:DNA-binding NtrC family response regulator